jgi:hypothetical protein
MSSITVHLKEYKSFEKRFESVKDLDNLKQHIFDWLGVQPAFQVLGKSQNNTVTLLLSPLADSPKQDKAIYTPIVEGFDVSLALPERGNVDHLRSKSGSKESSTEAAHIVSFEVMKKLAETSGLKISFNKKLTTLFGKLMGHDDNLVIVSKAYNQIDRKLDAEIKACLDLYGERGTTKEFQKAVKNLSLEVKGRVQIVCKVLETLFIPVAKLESKENKLDTEYEEFLKFLEQSLHRLRKL